VLLAFLAADDIPSSLPTQHPDQLPARLAATIQDPLAYQQVIGALRRYSLIKTSQNGQVLRVHRLVQAVTRHLLGPDQAPQWASATLRLVSSAFPADPTSPDVRPACARLLSHALAATGHTERLGVDPETTSRLLDAAGRHLWLRGDYRQAQAFAERALAPVCTRAIARHCLIPAGASPRPTTPSPRLHRAPLAPTRPARVPCAATGAPHGGPAAAVPSPEQPQAPP
jgi:hypothetical protein